MRDAQIQQGIFSGGFAENMDNLEITSIGG
jgi:hypothetical protein